MNSVSIFLFIVGFIVQSFIMISKPIKKGDVPTILFILPISFLFVSLLSFSESFYSLDFIFLMSIAIGGIIYAFLFSERLISSIGARTLLLVNILVVYVVLDGVGSHSFWFLILIIPTLLTVYNAISNIDFHFRAKFLFYCWYILLLLIACFSQYSFEELNSVFSSSTVQVSYLRAFTLGGVYLYILVNILFLVRFIPHIRQDETMKSVIYRLSEHKKLLALGYVRHKGDRIGNVLTLIFSAIFLYINSIYAFLDLPTLIFVTLALIPVINIYLQPKATQKP